MSRDGHAGHAGLAAVPKRVHRHAGQRLREAAARLSGYNGVENDMKRADAVASDKEVDPAFKDVELRSSWANSGELERATPTN